MHHEPGVHAELAEPVDGGLANGVGGELADEAGAVAEVGEGNSDVGLPAPGGVSKVLAWEKYERPGGESRSVISPEVRQEARGVPRGVYG